MTFDEVLDITATIPVLAEAVIDTTTHPSKGMTKVTTNERVLIWANLGYSGYEIEVRRRLVAANKNPDGFVVGDLPWGERVGGTALIKHNNQDYLQCISLDEGEVKAFIGRIEVNPSDVPDVFLRDKSASQAGFRQGLTPSEAVIVRTYNINNINRLALV